MLAIRGDEIHSSIEIESVFTRINSSLTFNRSTKPASPGGEAPSKHKEGFDPSALTCVTDICRPVWSRPVASHRDLGAAVARRLLGATNLHVCSPACLPAAPSVLLRVNFNAAGRPNGPGEGSTNSVFPVPLTCFSLQGGHWFVQRSKHPEQL